MQEHDMEMGGESSSHEHGGVSRMKLAVALIGAGYALVHMLFSTVISLPDWPTLLIATVIQFWVASDFYSMAWMALKKGSSNMRNRDRREMRSVWWYIWCVRAMEGSRHKLVSEGLVAPPQRSF